MCVLLRALVDASMCFQEGESSVWMVCRPCAGLWGVDCGVLNRSLLMLCLGIWLWCVPLCLHSLAAVSSSLSSFFPMFSFFLLLHPSLRFPFFLPVALDSWFGTCIYICTLSQEWFPNSLSDAAPQAGQMNSSTPSPTPPMFKH